LVGVERIADQLSKTGCYPRPGTLAYIRNPEICDHRIAQAGDEPLSEAVDVVGRGRPLRFDPAGGPDGANVNFISEPPGGAHADPNAAAQLLAPYLEKALRELQKVKPSLLPEERYKKFRKMGVFEKA
jgi:hypothetical protein